jgi:2-polyprenyl-6-methoxyphenol hydroxylase-like FAD-dependent oxidoreductase
MAGFSVHNRLISTIWGYRISTDNLPQREFGQVFLGAPAPILIYPISRDIARVLFDIPYKTTNPSTVAEYLALAQNMPLGLREEVARAIGTQNRLSVVTRATTTERCSRGRVVLVGDAGGSCHPLTATGMTMCVSDALLLRQALSERRGDLLAALQLYEQRRHWPQVTRLMLADALRDALCGTSPASRVVQGGILALWRDSAEARSATVALLSTADGRPFALTRQIVAAMYRGFLNHLRNPKPENREVGVFSVAQLLMAMLFRNIRQVLRGRGSVASETIGLLRSRSKRG